MNRFLQIFKIKDLRNKVLIVAGLLVAYRVLAAIPIPGVDAARLQQLFQLKPAFRLFELLLRRRAFKPLGHDAWRGPLHHGDDHHAASDDHFPATSRRCITRKARAGRRSSTSTRGFSRCRLALVHAYGFLTLLISQGVIDRPAPFALCDEHHRDRLRFHDRAVARRAHHRTESGERHIAHHLGRYPCAPALVPRNARRVLHADASHDLFRLRGRRSRSLSRVSCI